MIELISARLNVSCTSLGLDMVSEFMGFLITTSSTAIE